MHYLQQNILKILATRESARYAEIKPKAIESNHFLYHLNQLLKSGLVSKTPEKAYTLSHKGEQYIDTISFDSFKVRSQPKIVNLLAVVNDQNEYLLYKRKHQPFIGLMGFPYGKIHLGETIRESSERELLEKTGLDVKLRHIGDMYITVFQDNALISHSLYHIHFGKLSPDIDHSANEPSHSECFWSRINESQPEKYFPGFVQILSRIQKNSETKFFEELIFRS